MNAAKAANMEPIPGYRLISPLGSGGFGEVWKCEAPGGLFKAVKFVRGEGDGIHPNGAGAAQELRALQHVKALRHPFLLSMDRVEFVDGELVIVMELADRSLNDLLEEYRAAGRPGVPRAELLGYLAEAAEVLDLLNREHGLQHLDIKPRNLFLVGRHIKVADFGLVNSLAEMTGAAANAVLLSAVTPMYAAPESFLGKVTLFSDQYSLAISYHELLVGQPPFAGKNFRQLALQHMQAVPDLSQLPPADRPVLAQALAKDPRGRFPSCTAFIEALQTTVTGEFRLPQFAAHQRSQSDTNADIHLANLCSTPVGSKTMPRIGLSAEVVLDNRPANTEELTAETPPAQMNRPTLPAPSIDPLAGYQFLECVSRTDGGETWMARTGDGRERLVQFFSGIHWGGDKEEERLSLLRTFRHEAVVPMELNVSGDHRLALITDVCPKSLDSRLQECQAAGLPGIPRPELLARLSEAAETLDDLFEEYGLRHLGLTPRRLTLKNGRLRLHHLGLAELIHLPVGQQGVVNGRYSAPKLFEEPHPSSDAYSLALIYCELLTGVHPLHNLGSRKSSSRRHHVQPNLSMIPSADHAVLQRALHTDPNRRYVACTDLIAALAADGANQPMPALSGPTSSLSNDLEDSAFPMTMRVRMRQLINGLVAGAAGDLEVREYRNARCLLHPGRHLEHQFFARIAQGVSKLMAEGFRFHWNAEAVEMNERRVVVIVPLSGTLWQRLTGSRPGLKVFIDLPQAAATAVSEVRVRIEPVGCGRQAALAVMEETAPKLLDSLRTFFQAQPERRSQARLPLDQIIEVLPIWAGGIEGDAVVSQTRDISMRGMKFRSPCQPASQQVNIHLPGWSSDHTLSLAASVVRAVPCAGGYEVSVRFLVEEA